MIVNQLKLKNLNEQTVAGNKMIAEFMELQYDRDWGKYEKRNFTAGDADWYEPNGLKYHSSWDWLKPVIDKLFEYSIANPDEVKHIIQMRAVVGIEPAWHRVVEAIEKLKSVRSDLSNQ